MTASQNTTSRRTLLSAALVTGACIGSVPCASADPIDAEPPPSLPAQRQAMARLIGLSGNWRGYSEAIPGQPHNLYYLRRAERDMDGVLLLIRGSGYPDSDRSDSPLVNALIIVSYDDASRNYAVRSYTDGRAGTAEAYLLDGHLRWTIIAGHTAERTTIAIQNDEWHEINETSRDGGVTWIRTAEMWLGRVARNAP